MKYEAQQHVTDRELAALRSQGVVSRFRAALTDAHLGTKLPKGALPEVTIGVAFRTDGNGKVHGDHDVRGLLAVNDLPEVGCKVKCVALPRGASGSVTPCRNQKAAFSELDGIDMLYIPGAPAAPVSQVATSRDAVLGEEERNFNKKTHPGLERPADKPGRKVYDTALREFQECSSRAPYEARLINIARLRGIPVLAICAGSWRLLESYGGKVRTMPLAQRARHKAEKREETWTLAHGIKTLPGTMVGGKSIAVGGGVRELDDANSTHWAVACIRYNARRRDFGLEAVDPALAEPDQLLEISAFATDPLAATVEAFESRYGAPAIGIQWHPETYLPGMPGEHQGSPEGRTHARSLFLFIVGAALTARNRRVMVSHLLTRESEAFAALCDAARTARSCQTVAAASHLQYAAQLLPQRDWTPRMLLLQQAVDLLLDYARARESVGGGNSYMGAMSLLKDLGIRL